MDPLYCDGHTASDGKRLRDQAATSERDMSVGEIPPFNPYHRWLGIPPKDQPPHLYRLLGLEPFESDPAVIDSAADRQMAHVRTFQNGPRGKISQQILNELSAARVLLLDPEKKKLYDRKLAARLQPSPQANTPRVKTTERPSPPNSVPPPAQRDAHQRQAASVDKSPPNIGRPNKAARGEAAPWWRRADVIVSMVVLVLVVVTSLAAPSLVGDRRDGRQQAESPPGKSTPNAPAADADRPRNTASSSEQSRRVSLPRKSPAKKQTANSDNGTSDDSESTQSRDPKVKPASGTGANTGQASTGQASTGHASTPQGVETSIFALEFAGRDFVEIPGTQQAASWNRTFTAEMWVRWNPDGHDHLLMGTLVRPPKMRAFGGWSLGVMSNEETCVIFPTVHLGGSRNRVELAARPWHHIALVHDDQGWGHTYVDGRRVASGKTNYDDKELANLCLGVPKNAGEKANFFGVVRAFRLSSNARYQDHFATPTTYDFENDAHTVVLLDFRARGEQQILDRSGIGRHGQLSGARWVALDETDAE